MSIVDGGIVRTSILIMHIIICFITCHLSFASNILYFWCRGHISPACVHFFWTISLQNIFWHILRYSYLVEWRPVCKKENHLLWSWHSKSVAYICYQYVINLYFSLNILIISNTLANNYILTSISTAYR